MATTVVFDLIGTLVTQLRAAMPTVNVYDGSGNSDDPGDYLMIGVGDPDDERPQMADSQQSWAGLGANARDEVGTISCVALSWNGNADPAACRTAIKAIVGAVENHLRADPNLGGAVTGLQWTGFGTNASGELIEADDGTALLWRFDIAFKARI